MSSYIVKIIPTDENFVPSIEERHAIKNHLKLVTSTKEITDRLYDSITFIDAGSNFDGVKCNCCLEEIETEWWGEQMDICSSLEFNNLFIITPCCSSATALNKLIYIWPAGFAKYVIQIMNPYETEVLEIEKILANTSYKLIRAHY